MRESELNTAFLISGGGTTAEAAIKAIQRGELQRIRPVAVIASRPDADGISKAIALGVETYVLQKKQFPTEEAFGKTLLKLLKHLGVDLVSQNGWLAHTPDIVVDAYSQKIINQHPGPLDPGRMDQKGRQLDFGGKGMYGSRVTAARLAYSWTAEEEPPFTEATTHYVTSAYDAGDLIRVEEFAIPTLGSQVTTAHFRTHPELKEHLIATTKHVQAMLLPLEHKNVIATLQRFAHEHAVTGFRRAQSLIPDGKERILFQAKQLARDVFPKG